jgi:hypothetical protein
MRLARVTILPGAATAPADEAVLRNCLWAVVHEHDLVEHIAVRSTADRFEVGVFTRSGTDREGRATAFGLVERALLNSPQFFEWRMSEARII